MAAFAFVLAGLPAFFAPVRRKAPLLALSVHASAGAKQPVRGAKKTRTLLAAIDSGPQGSSVERFRELMLPQLDAVYNLARYLTHGDADAEDLAHDAYVRAQRGFATYRGGDAKAWMLAIVRNCFMSWAKVRRSRSMQPADQLAQLPAECETPEAAFEHREEAGALRRLIEDLPPHLAEVIVLREMEELSYRQIAAIINAPIGTVMSRLARAREALANAWRTQMDEARP